MKRVPRKQASPAQPDQPLRDHPISPNHTEDGKFKKGNTAVGAGRPRGSRNKVGELFLMDLQDLWADQGMKILHRVARDKPHEVLKVIASLLPRQLHVQMNQLADYSDEQLAQLRAMLEVRVEGREDPKLIEGQVIDAESESVA